MTLNIKLAPSVRKARAALAFSAGIGLIVGGAIAPIAYQAGKSGNPTLSDLLFGNTEISPVIAIGMLFGLILIAAVSLWYYRNIDEHDRASQEHASLVAINIYVFLTIAWWIASKGQIAPPVSALWIFVAVVVVWCTVWLLRRYR